MNSVGIILAKLGLDTRDFKAGLADAQNVSGKFSASLFGMGDIGTVLGGAGLGALTKNLLDNAKHVEYLSERFGVSAETIQRWGHAAELAGSNLEAMTMGFNRLDVSSSKALGGNEELLGHFNALGISISDLRTLAPDELMKRIGSSSMGAADLVAVLGRNGTELRPVLAGIADGTIKFGAAVSDVDIKKLAAISDFFERAKQGAKVGGQDFLAGTITTMRTFATAAGQVTADIFTGNFKKLTLAGIARTMLEARAEVEGEQRADAQKGKPRTFGGEDEQSKLDDKVQKAKETVAALRMQLAGEEQLATALKTNAEYQEKITDAKRKGLTALAQELELERELTLQKQAQDAATKHLERAKLSSKELADIPSERAGGPAGSIQHSAYLARLAEREENIAESFRQRGDVEGALRHQDREREIKLDIPELRESEKERNSIDASTKIEQIKNDVQSIAQNQLQVVSE